MRQFLLIAPLVLAGLCAAGSLVAQTTLPAPLTFTGAIGATVVEDNLRHQGRPAMLVLNLLDANGKPTKLCNRAQIPWSAAVATTNGKATSIKNAIDHAQSKQAKFVLVTSEDTTDSDGMYCGIASLDPAS